MQTQPTHSNDPAIDLAPLHRLLQMAGTDGAPALLAALVDDMKSAQTGLDAAWSGPDYTLLRGHSHILIALAGTVGDSDLQTLAQQVNDAANDQDSERIAVMRLIVKHAIEKLIASLMRLHLDVRA